MGTNLIRNMLLLLRSSIWPPVSVFNALPLSSVVPRYSLRPAHLVRLNFITLIISRGSKITKPFIIQNSPASCYSPRRIIFKYPKPTFPHCERPSGICKQKSAGLTTSCILTFTANLLHTLHTSGQLPPVLASCSNDAHVYVTVAGRRIGPPQQHPTQKNTDVNTCPKVGFERSDTACGWADDVKVYGN